MHINICARAHTYTHIYIYIHTHPHTQLAFTRDDALYSCCHPCVLSNYWRGQMTHQYNSRWKQSMHTGLFWACAKPKKINKEKVL